MDAVVSHESALELLNLSDVVPRTVHLTLPRHRRGLAGTHRRDRAYHHASAGTRRGGGARGIPMTAPARSIADAAAWGTAPEQIVAAVVDALDRELTTGDDLRAAAHRHGRRVADLIDQGLAEVDPP